MALAGWVRWWRLAAVCLAMFVALGTSLGVAYAQGSVRDDCETLRSAEARCECRHGVRALLAEQYSQFPRRDYNVVSFDARADYQLANYDRWRMEEWNQMCARLDLVSTTKGLVRGLALALTGIAAISFVWSIVQYMQESVAGGQVVQARNNAIRIIVGLIIFGSTWLIYESLLVALFGTSQFSPGSFAGVGGLFYIVGN